MWEKDALNYPVLRGMIMTIALCSKTILLEVVGISWDTGDGAMGSQLGLVTVAQVVIAVAVNMVGDDLSLLMFFCHFATTLSHNAEEKLNDKAQTRRFSAGDHRALKPFPRLFRCCT